MITATHVGHIRVTERRTDLVYMQEARDETMCSVSERGLGEDHYGNQKKDNTAGPVELDTCLLGRLFQRDLPIHEDNSKDVEVKGHLESWVLAR